MIQGRCWNNPHVTENKRGRGDFPLPGMKSDPNLNSCWKKRQSVDSQSQDVPLGGISWSRKVGGAAAEGRGVPAGGTKVPAGED